jgi:two-component system response regulator
MLRIGICDENTKDRTVIRQIVTDTLFREEELSYIEYAEAETLEQEIQASTVPFDLLLMEMKYKNTSGLQLAKQIREKNLDVDLLFVTDESDHVYEGYHVQAQGYVLKEDMKTQLPDCLRQYMKRRAQTGTILVKSESVVRSIPIATIRYIESRARVLLLHTKNEVIPFYGKLADIEHKVLQHGFVRIHQSFLVRKAAIAAINGYEAVVGEDTLPISRKYYKTVQMQFQLKQKIQVAEEDIDPTVTRSLAKSMENNGAIIGTKGELLGIIYRMKDGESLTIGRDAEKCQIVLKKSNVSREHCIVRRLDDDTYEVENCSKNGVYVEGAYLGKGNKVQAETGNRVWLCDESQEFRLG